MVGGIEVGDGNKPGRLRLAALTDYGAGSLNAFIARNIAPASTAKTDGWAGYAGVPVNQHDPHVIGAMAAHLVLPWIHQMFSNLKGWARGVYKRFTGKGGTGENKSSLCNDLLSCRRTEIDFINGAIVRLGTEHGVPTPVTKTLIAAVKALESHYLA